MSRILPIIMTGTALLMSVPTQAQEQGRFYVGGGFGVVFAGNTRTDGVFANTGTILDGQRLGPEPGRTASGNFDPSPTSANLTFGYDVENGRFRRFRFEGEIFYQEADTDNYSGLLDGTNINPAGRVDTTISGVVLNAAFDIRQFGNLTTFFYLGIGRANAETEFDFQDRGGVAVDGNVQVLQGGIGAELPFDNRTTFNLRYRFRRAGLNVAGLDTDIDAQIIEAGIRYSF